jgi:DHA1 family bicyclomycin/chloramphenicol resistance-like MFS transporter
MLKPYKGHTLLLLLSMTLLGVFPLDVILPSFPALSAHFNTPSATIALSISLFAIGFSLSQFFLGPLSDRLGRKRLLIMGMVVAIIGALGCVLSTEFSTFILWRILQAAGCGCFVLSNALVQDLFSRDERERVRILMTTASGLFISTSPLMGTALQHAFGWTGSFCLFAVIAGLVLLHATWVLPVTVAPASSLRFWQSCVLVISNARFMGFSLIAAFAFTCHFSFIAISPVIFLDGFGLSAFEFSLILLAYGAAYVMGGLVASRLQKVLGHPHQLKTGLVLIGLAGVILIALHVTTERSFLTFLLPMMVCTIGTTIARPAATSQAMDFFPNNAGAASSVLNTLVFVTGGVFSGLASLAVMNVEYVLSVGFMVVSGLGWILVRAVYAPESCTQASL